MRFVKKVTALTIGAEDFDPSSYGWTKFANFMHGLSSQMQARENSQVAGPLEKALAKEVHKHLEKASEALDQKVDEVEKEVEQGIEDDK